MEQIYKRKEIKMLDKKQVAKCPFLGLKNCSSKCTFFRRGVRYNELTGENFPIESCAINIIADNLEAMHNRTYMIQSEVGKAKDAIIMKTLVDLNVITQEQSQSEVMKIANPHILECTCETKKLPEK